MSEATYAITGNTRCEVGRATRQSYLTRLTVGLSFGDLLVALGCLAGGFWIRFESALSSVGVRGAEISVTDYLPQFGLALCVLAVLLVTTGRYERESIIRSRYGALLMLKPVLLWGIIFLAVSLTIKMQPMLSRLFVFYALALMICILPAWRLAVAHFIVHRFLGENLRQKTLVVGWDGAVERILKHSENASGLFPLKIEGIVSLDAKDDLACLPEGMPCWKGLDRLETIMSSNKYDTVLLGDSGIPIGAKREIHQLCAREMMDVMVLPSMDKLASCLVVETMNGIPLLTQNRRPLDHMGNAFIKRSVDIVGAVVGLLVFAPVIAVFSWCVYRESPGPVFYRQVRTGKHGKSFSIIKIRSMKLDAEVDSGATWCQEADPRRLKIGALMRRTNIDELPQFWNVLKGEMSLVGPRPERPELIHDFKDEIDYYNLRHTIKPGLTGWAQVNGWRGDTCLRSRIACDIEYIERASLWFDCFIMLKTFSARENAY